MQVNSAAEMKHHRQSLRQLRQIRHSVPTATLQMLVVALVHSRLAMEIECWLACQLTCYVSPVLFCDGTSRYGVPENLTTG